VLGSAVLLIVSFPNFNQPWCAWVALLPWLVALRGLTSRQAFAWSYLVGLLFFLGSIWWLTKLTAFGGAMALVGWLVLCAYLALYFAAFGWLVRSVLMQKPFSDIRHQTSDISKIHGQTRRSRIPLLLKSEVWSLWSDQWFALLVVPACWVALEYLRSHLLSGLGWNLLGYSQTPSLTAIQLANVTGVWGVSFLIVMVNAGLAIYLLDKARHRAVPLLLALVAVVGGWGYGRAAVSRAPAGQPIRVAVVQGNIPQDEKWNETKQESILLQYERLTRYAAVLRPALIIWPETAVPAFLGLHEAITRRMLALSRELGIPLLVGAPTGRFDGPQLRMGNSAILIEQGRLAAQYAKLHLVPFGEFVPGESFAPWLRQILPPIGEFSPGQKYTVFSMPNDESRMTNTKLHVLRSYSAFGTRHSALKFSVLICFEDVFPNLARRFVRRGAQMLVTITNDAWFGDTGAAYQHAQASTFRAVELGVPMIRAANTGWSGCIDAHGRWLTSVRDARGKELFVDGVTTCDVAPREGPPTVYARFGDWFAWLCGLVLFARLLLLTLFGKVS